MSTKTSIKRVALVAVSALGFGLLSVMPANAAAITAVTCANATETITTKGASAVDLCTNATFTGEAGAGDTITIGTITGPVGAIVEIASIEGVAVASTPFTKTIGANGTVAGGTLTVGTTGVTDGDEIEGHVSMPGTYTIVIGGFTVTLVATQNQAADNAELTSLSLTASAGNSFALGTAASFTVAATKGTGGNAYDDQDDMVLKFIVSSQPTAATTQLSVDATRGTATAAGTNNTDGCFLNEVDGVRATIFVTCGPSDGASATFAALGTVAITPTVAGTYTLTAWYDQNGDNAISASEVNVATTATFSAAGALTQIASSTSTTVDRASTVAATTAQASARVGTLVAVTPSVKLTADANGGGIASGEWGVTLAYALTKPATSLAALSASSQTLDSAAVSVSGGVDTEGSAQNATNITFTPDVAGTYTFVAWHDANGNAQVDTGEASGSVAIVIAADAPVLTLKVFGTKTTTGGNGALVRATLTNGGVAASLGASETISITASGGAVPSVNVLNRNSFDAYGQAFFNVTSASAITSTITFSGAGSTSIAAVTQTTSIEFVAATATALAQAYTVSKPTSTTAYAGTAIAVVSGESIFYNPASAASVSITGKSSHAKDDVVLMTVTDGAAGCITGKANAVYDQALTVATGASATTNTISAAVSAPLNSGVCGTAMAAAAKSSPVTFGTIAVTDNGGADTFTLKASPSLNKSITATTTNLGALNGSSVTVSALVRDQYHAVRANSAVTVTLNAGSRNSGVFVTRNLVSDATGLVTWTYTDAPLSANSSLMTDTFTLASAFSAADAAALANEGAVYANGSTSVTFRASYGVSKVEVTGGNTDAGVTSSTKSVKDIVAGDATLGLGAELGGVTFSAKVTDANGAAISGVPVTWTVSDAGTKANVKTTFATTYTGADGVATATSAVYAWIAGTYTVTATAGGIVGTGEVTFANITGADERAISATTQGSTVTATVVDRFGNPVKGVRVYATKTGVGYFGTGVSKISDTTGADGTVTFNIAGGDAVVTVSTIDYDGAPGAKGSGQTCAAKGYVTCEDDVADRTAFAATVAGTTLTAEKGIGASFDAAGVATAPAVTVTGAVSPAVEAAAAAADAAAEAIDAANAATDAANLAAEAADAATVAAEEARDAADAATAAVEELATQVATLMAALKAQITTLANTVAKIAKKVKA